MLEHLNAVNDVKILSVTDEAFASYGRVVTGVDFAEMIAYMEANTSIPENGNIYLGLGSAAGSAARSADRAAGADGDMPIQVGYCNGRNRRESNHAQVHYLPGSGNHQLPLHSI